ncbi:hypothetical protein [Achromobacter xylosoxidans]|uniref:hypothetical protein n=1 Tax=Alcaligenes xylosoxydans xylosoxydans TaxID=85698 RepID=UPI002A76310A|nr:hypothetical protein [Achromobacter xylosoxidans]WPQ34333.1 hypothetical protein SLH34_27585 [Achromobacter xylosoxidans]
MTNSYDVAHGLSQDEPGPLEPVEIAQQDDTLARTGNTARDQEMYAAGIRTGEENAKHNAAIRAAAGWLPIESAPKDGTEILAWREDCGQFIASYTSADAFPLTQAELDAYDEATLFAKDWFTQWPQALRLEGSEIPTKWQPLPADPCPTCNDQGAVGNILTAEPCPDCAAPGVSTVEDAQAVAWMDPDTQDVISAERKASWLSEYGAGGAAKAATYTRALGDLRPAPAAGDARDAAVGAAIGRACAELPFGYSIELSLEGGYGGARLIDPEDRETELDQDERDLAKEINAAIDAALAAQRKGDA